MVSVGSYMKVWKITAHEKYTDLQVSTSTKNKQTGEYTTDFSGFVRCVGKAHDKAMNLNEGDSIKIGNFGVTNNYSKAKNTTYTNITMFDFELPENANNNSVSDDGFMNIPDGLDTELPFN